MPDPIVIILMGSDHDFSIMKEAGDILDSFGIPYEYSVASAHRSPQKTVDLAKTAEDRGIKVIIVGAGKAAHLAGTVAAWTTIPVLGVPIDASLGGLDALLSTVQMPEGVPVGTMGIGKSGAKNGALFAIQILAVSDPDLSLKLHQYKARLAREVDEKDRKIKENRRLSV
ncbi:5-(carboxyamino)imidazole ribonucleotide mutase [bacterium]|nr:5-(carboxyamino)imidazole ribonucleotide mutase [bacterium]